MKKSKGMSVGSAGKKVASGRAEMRMTTGKAAIAATGMKGRPTSDKQDQHIVRA